MIGRTLSHYKVLEEISRGGMGIVYKALDVKLTREVALKVLPPELVSDPERKRRFVQEAQAAAALNHPNIASIYEIDEVDGVDFIAMELIEGDRLSDVLKRGAIPLERVIDIAIEVAEGMARAHEKGVIHRDLKPANLMLTQDGHAKIIDFGLAKLLEPLLRRLEPGTEGPTLARLETREGSVQGTVAYMSPEQARAEHVDARTDIFSFGALLYEMLAGTSPFRRGTFAETLAAILNEVPTPPSEIGIQIPDVLDRVLRKSLAKDKNGRYQNMKDLILDLRELREDMVSGAHDRAATKTGSRARGLWAVAASAGFLLAAVVSLLLFSHTSRPVGIGASGRPAVAVLYFENNTGDEQIRWLSQGLPSMLLTDLAQTPGLDVVSSQRIHEILEQIGEDDTETVDKGIAAEVARRSGAGAVVVGSIFKSGEEIRIDVQIEDLGSGRVLSAQSVRGTDVFPLVDDLTARIRSGLRLTDAPPAPRVADVTTSSLEAYRLYSEALDARRNVRYTDARALLEKAIALDPSFAIAHFELSRIARIYGQRELEEDHMAKVIQNLNRLPEREKLLIQAQQVRISGADTTRAIELLESLVEKYPDEEDAYFEIASIHRTEGRADEALATLARGVSAIPQSGTLHNNYGYGLLRAGRYYDARSEFEAYARIRPEEPNPYDSLGEVHLLLGDVEGALKSYGRALEVDPNFANSHGGRAWAYSMMGRYEAAAEEADVLRERAVRLGIPLTAWHFMTAFSLSRVGRYAESDEEIRKAQDLAEELGDDVNGTGVHLFEALNRLERDDLDGAIAEARRAEARSQMGKTPALAEAQRRIARSLEGIALARSGRLEASRRNLGELENYREDLPEGWFHFALAGEIALKEGKLNEAEEAYASGTAKKVWFNLGTLVPTVLVQHAPFRDGLARIREARGDWRGAVEAYRELNTPGPDNPWTSWLEPRFVLQTARLLREHEDDQEARKEYLRFLELWKDADSELPEFKEAQAFIAASQR